MPTLRSNAITVFRKQGMIIVFWNKEWAFLCRTETHNNFLVIQFRIPLWRDRKKTPKRGLVRPVLFKQFIVTIKAISRNGSPHAPSEKAAIPINDWNFQNSPN